VLIRTYNVIYELIDEMKDVVEGMLKIDQLDEVFGTATILAEFPFGKTDRIAGCRVLDGTIAKGPKVRVVRGRINGDTGEVEGEVEVIGEGKIRSLKKGREEVPSISKGGECGIMFDTEIDWHVGDIVQTYRIL
jgi:translation initiation factor IF-2